MISNEAFEAYLNELTSHQQTAIRFVRSKLFELDPTLTERGDEGKWFRGMLVYETPSGMFLYALGPRPDGSTSFHMMPYYGSTELQKLYGAALKKFFTGKSCIKFGKIEDLPAGVLEAVIVAGTGGMRAAMEAMSAHRKGPRARRVESVL